MGIRRRRGSGASATRERHGSAVIDVRHLIASAVTAPLLPLLVLQGRRVRRVTPRLPEASGPTHGRSGSGTPSLSLLVVGESTVAGVGAASHETALTGQLALVLAERVGREVQWRAVGANGATAACTREVLLPRVPANPVDVVVIALGVNDVLRLHSPARWRRDLAQLVIAIRERVGAAPVVLATMPPLGRFPAFPEPLRSVLGSRAAALARATVHLTRDLESATACTGTLVEDLSHYASDRFHPSELGYQVWARLMAPDVADAVSKCRVEAVKDHGLNGSDGSRRI